MKNSSRAGMVRATPVGATGTHGECVHVECDELGIEYSLWVQQDCTPVRGNALASGDNEEDKRCEDEIISRLDSGDVWAWADVTVVAKFKNFEGTDTLGGCCYRNTAEFVREGSSGDGYYGDMKYEARARLVASLLEAKTAIAELGVKE